MKIAILGTGGVGQTIAAALVAKGHTIMIGTRVPAETLARTAPDAMGGAAFSVWAAANPRVAVKTFADAVRGAELVVNALSGQGVLPVLTALGAALDGLVLLDISNPLDFSKGFPPSLSVSNTDSLGEQIQRALPKSLVVKTLNIVSAPVMVNPSSLPGGQPTMFVSGNDASAKATVTGLLKKEFGWVEVLDLGDITTSRGTEMMLAIWVRTLGVVQTPMFGFKVVR